MTKPRICPRCLYLFAVTVNPPFSGGLPDSAEYNEEKIEEIEKILKKLGKCRCKISASHS